MEVLVKPPVPRLRVAAGAWVTTAALASWLACSADPCGLRACDIRDGDCQRSAATAAACLLDQPPQQIPVALMTRSQYVQEQLAGSNAGDVVREQRRLDALALMDLADPGVTPQTAATALSGRVAAFYSPGDKRITIVTEDGDDGPLDGAWNTSLLVHESTHALQDAAGRLAFPLGDDDTSYDRLLVRGALVEGEASLVESLATLGLFDHAASDVPWDRLFARLHPLAERIAAASPVPADLAYSYFAYPFGLSTAYRAYATSGTAGLAGLWSSPPLSTRQILLPPGAPELAAPVVEDLGPEAVPALPSEFAFLDGARMGAFVFKLFLLRPQLRSGQAPGSASTDALVAKLRGDYLALFWRGDHPVATWRLRFADRAMALQAANHLGQAARHWSMVTIDRDLILYAPSGSVNTPPGGEDLAKLLATATWKTPPPPAALSRTARFAATIACPHRP